MHVTDAMALQGEFDKVKGWTDRKVSVLMNKLAALLSHQDKKRFHAFVSVLDIQARERLIAAGTSIPKPELICSETCVGSAFVWGVSQCPVEKELEVHTMDFFFARSEKFKHHFDLACRKGKKQKGMIWGLVNSVDEVDMGKTPGIQAADMLVWADRMEYGKRFPTAHAIFKQVIPSHRFEINENSLREKYCKVRL
jgi:hypothetical protein